ncbi:MAG: hypothetical protein LBD29_01270 [Treponema sp.]|nr:hypothetical protein [Treponema sp.]
MTCRQRLDDNESIERLTHAAWEVTSMDMAVPALGNRSETAVEIPA